MSLSGLLCDSPCRPYVSGSPNGQGTCVRDQLWVKSAQATDGMSNTFLVVEQSDFCRGYDEEGNYEEVECDACVWGLHTGSTGDEWRNYGDSHQLTTVMHPVNMKSSSALNVRGGAVNTPIQSAHPGGAVCSRGDGSADFVDEDIEIQILYDLADRDTSKRIATAP